MSSFNRKDLELMLALADGASELHTELGEEDAAYEMGGLAGRISRAIEELPKDEC